MFKAFKRFLKIKPATSQIFFDDSALNYDVDAEFEDGFRPTLGLESPKVWDQNFRIRLTSRQTGKKIDINFKFTHAFKDE